MNRDDGAEAIVLPTEHHLEFLAFDFGARGGECSLGFAGRLGIVEAFFLGHREKHASLVERLFKLLEAGELDFDALLFLEDRLRGFRVVPEVLLDGLVGEFLSAGGQLGDVKDASGELRCELRDRSLAGECR
jgi:hypothetical protein